VLGQLSQTELVEGKTIGIDATTLEANAAMRNIVRRDTGESYTDFLQGLAQASGIKTPTRAQSNARPTNSDTTRSLGSALHPRIAGLHVSTSQFHARCSF